MVKSGNWGISMPWYFCFQPSYWCPKKTEVEAGKQSEDSLVEPLPESHKAGFKVSNIIKEFTVKGKAKRAVDELSFTAVQNEITVLLGHNGAGKSTTISMLTSLIKRTTGRASIFGIDMFNDLKNVRKIMGMCP